MLSLSLLLLLRWHLCCAALLFFHCTGWLFPVACLCCLYLHRASLFRLIVVFAAHCCKGTADDNTVAFAANATTSANAITIAATAVTVVVAAATTLLPPPQQPPLLPFLPLPL
jgi:hypothetical protein